MSHVPHAFQHARRLVLSAPMLLHQHALVIPILPDFAIKLESGPSFETYSTPRRYGSRVHEARGAVLFEFVIPF